MLFKYVAFLFKRVVNDYKEFQFRQAIRREVIRYVQDRSSWIGTNIMKHDMSQIGTVNQIYKQNQEFIKNNPELFPGLNN